MATTILQSFSTFKSNLEITGLQQETVPTRQNNVRDAVKRELVVLDSFLTGSYSRSTMIAPLSEADIDIFVILSSEYYKKDGQAKLLDKVKTVVKKTYTKTPKISRNGQAVTITFTDFFVDIVPAFNRKGGGYLIPNSAIGEWIATDPKAHVKIMSEHNKKHNGNLVPLVKMIKCWNRNISFSFNSFHLEVMALQIFDGVKITDSTSGARYFFDKAKDYVKKKNPDPAGYNDDVGAYLYTDAKISGAVSNLTTAYNRAVKAESFAKENNIAEAVDEWKKIFGNKFPAFG